VKLKFVIFETKAAPWVEAARQEYVAKINPFFPLELVSLKSPHAERENAEVKKRKEAELLLKTLNEKDFLVLFDEAGKTFVSSEDFAKTLSRVLESNKAQIVLCIGGPYGFSESVVKRSSARWSLSGLTMNHWLAQVVALEQLYRGLTILKGIPYHNR
jgi:23S rRNA (pseudouridine1915-N3)-methyltransferase